MMPDVKLKYAIAGTGSALWWLDNSGGQPWSGIAADYPTVNLLPHSSSSNWRQTAQGSFIVTAPFELAAAQPLTITATMVNAHADAIFDVGFALLLEHARVKAILFVRRPDDGTLFGDQGPITELTYADPSPGVALTHAPGGLLDITLGQVRYGQVVDPSDCTNKCSCRLTASYTPGAGKYKLLFGMFAMVPLTIPSKPAAMVVSCDPIPNLA
jgi:hypothetical protein